MKHGPLANRRGDVTLTVSLADDGLRIVLTNPGAFAGPRAGGQGLEIVRRRLALTYGGRASFTIGSNAQNESRTDAVIVVPRASVDSHVDATPRARL
jgi:LytS/YehU family sensor histidine kinase